jgi:arginyl-tRNA--protein-N-Asp/Glu arginylyltransferase
VYVLSSRDVILMSHLDSEQPIRLSSGECRLVVVQDELQPCPYRESTIARMPLRLPIGTVTPEVTDQLLDAGYRRSGDFVYRTQCPACSECKPTRVDVGKFRFTTSMKRVLKRGDRDLHSQWGNPQVDQQRVRLFNDHRLARKLGDGSQVDADSYRSFLGDSCCKTIELAVCWHDELFAVSIMDVGSNSVSAVYTHFDPLASRYSLGTYAVLKQIQWAIETNRQFVYLGMYVATNHHLNYKSRFAPQQRLCDGQWIDFEAG